MNLCVVKWHKMRFFMVEHRRTDTGWTSTVLDKPVFFFLDLLMTRNIFFHFIFRFIFISLRTSPAPSQWPTITGGMMLLKSEFEVSCCRIEIHQTENHLYLVQHRPKAKMWTQPLPKAFQTRLKPPHPTEFETISDPQRLYLFLL